MSPPKLKHQQCHEWALTTSARAEGVYTYHLITDYPWGKDVVKLSIQAGVAVGDILFYATNKHSSYVAGIRSNGAGGNEPSILKWKWEGSGVYSYTTPNNHEFDTPMCQTNYPSDVDKDKTITNQGWAWDVDFRTNPDVYH